MPYTITDQDYVSFLVKDEEFVVVPKKEFLEFQKSQEYPKFYRETDGEWEWETVDFWPNWVNPQELIDHLRS